MKWYVEFKDVHDVVVGKAELEAEDMADAIQQATEIQDGYKLVKSFKVQETPFVDEIEDLPW